MRKLGTYCVIVAAAVLLLCAGTARAGVQVAAGYLHTVGLEADGTVVAVGVNT